MFVCCMSMLVTSMHVGQILSDCSINVLSAKFGA